MRSWLLWLLVAVWVLGLFYLPDSVWTLPFSGSRLEVLSGHLILPAAKERPARASLPRLRQDARQHLLVAVRAGPGAGFRLQITDHATAAVVETKRFPARDGERRFTAVLEAVDRPRELRLALWNRSTSAVTIERVETRELPSGFRWPRRLYVVSIPLILVALALRNRQRLARYLGLLPPELERRQVKRWDRQTAILVLLLGFTVFRAAPVHQLLDAKHLTVVSHAFLRSGSVALPESFERNRRADRIYTLRPVGTKVFHFFAAAPAVLNAPFVGVFEMAGVAPVDEEGRYLGHNELRILRFIAATVAAALCAVLFLLARIWLPPVWALGLTLAFAGGTQIASSISRPFWSHSWSALLLAGALLLLAAPACRDSRRASVGAATLLCWAYFCRPPLSLAIVGVALYLLLARRQVFWSFALTGFGWAGLFVLYAQRNFAAWLPPYFLSSHLESGRLAGGLLLSSYPEAVVGTLLSPGRGLFVYVPLSLLTLYLVIRWWRWLPDRGLAVTALGVCVAHWQVVSLFRNWWGGQSFGPRLMSDLVPWIFLLSALGLAAVRRAAREERFRWTMAKWATVIVIVVASLFINLRGAWVQETQRGAGIWNWRYPQFLAGFLERPDFSPEPDSVGE